MGAPGEEAVHVSEEFEGDGSFGGNFECDRPHADETSRTQKIVAAWLAMIFVGMVTLGFVWIAAKVIESL